MIYKMWITKQLPKFNSGKNIDCRHAIPAGIPSELIHRLQLIQNMDLMSTGQVTPLLIQLHWLPVWHWIQLEILWHLILFIIFLLPTS